MSAFTLSPVGQNPDTPPSGTTDSDMAGGGAGRGGAQNPSQSPLVVVQGGRQPAPPRPAASPSPANQDNTLRNGYAAISHSVSGETAAIGLGFLLGGPVGAVIGGAAGPAAAAAIAWRARRRQDDENANRNDAGRAPGSGISGRDSSRNGRGNAGGRGRSNGPGNGNGTGSSGPRGSKRNGSEGTGNGAGRSNERGRSGAGGTGNSGKPKTKDPIADKLGKLGKDLADKLKNRNKADKADKTPKGGKGDKAGKGLKGGLVDGAKGLKGDGKKLKDKLTRNKNKSGKGDDVSWTSSPDGLDPKAKKDKKSRRKNKDADNDATSTSVPDGLDPKAPKGDGGAGDDLPPKPDYDPDEYVDAELIDDDDPGRPHEDPLEVVDAEVVDEDIEDRIAVVKRKREKARRRKAVEAGKKAAAKAARDQNAGDPRRVQKAVTERANQHIDAELAAQEDLLALTAGVKKVRKTGMTNYPAIQAAPAAKRQEGAAVARQISTRDTQAFAILRAMAAQLANGLHNDEDADMGDHIVELTGIPNMCKNLSVAVKEAAEALRRTAPLSPKVMKHLTNAAVAARTAGVMSEHIMVVFVDAHREDIIRILDPRIGEERWNIRNARGTLDAAKLRAAIASAHSARVALPSSGHGGNNSGGSKLVPASDGSTKKLIGLMQSFTRGHMVNVLSEIAGTGHGVDLVADSVGKLYRRMTKTWPTERIVDDTVLKTASQVRRVSTELKKAVREAQKSHARELRLNARGRAGKGARVERKWDVVGRRGNSN
ncbi:hypothetical protein [Streptomyces alfalfae]